MTMAEIKAALLTLDYDSDPEKAHIEADKLLIAALRENQVWGSADIVQQVIKAYEAVPKWYSQGVVMPRHKQLSRQQMTDQLNHAFDELEAWDKLIAKTYTTTHLSQIAQNVEADVTLTELQIRIKALIEHLSEYK